MCDVSVSPLLAGHVHHGFCTYYGRLDELGMGQGIWDLHTQYPLYKIVLTGWSLGAAAAVRHHDYRG